MACYLIAKGPGLLAIGCTRGSERTRAVPCSCGARSTAFCDFPLIGKGAGTTCSRPICAKCGSPRSLVAPVQPSPAYRHEHGGDLCRVHLELVARGHGPGLLTLLQVLRAVAPKGSALAAQIEAASVADLPALLDEAAEDARLFLASRSGDATAGPLLRLATVAQAMRAIVLSLRSVPDPVATYEAEARAVTLLQILQPKPEVP